MPVQKPARPRPGSSLMLPRVDDDASQRALDRITVGAQQAQAQINTAQAAIVAAQATADAVPTTGRYLGSQFLTGSGTYAPTSGTARVVIWLQAAGGGGGGAGAGANFSAAAGGGSGVCLQIAAAPTVADLTGIAYTGGNGGAGGTGTGSGGTGADAVITVAGVAYTAKGGTGGTGMVNTAGPADAVPGGGGVGSTSGATVLREVSFRGQRGFVAGSGQFPGDGAPSLFGTPGHGALGGAATAATGFGAGGGGGTNGATNGGSGAPTCILVEEYS